MRKVDSPRADVLNKEIAERFEKLYASYQGEDNAEKNQLLALHQQHVQAALNEHKRETMDRYMKSLEVQIHSLKITTMSVFIYFSPNTCLPYIQYEMFTVLYSVGVYFTLQVF